MKLHYMQTMNPRKVCAAAKYLGSPLEYVAIDVAGGELKAPHYLALNPNGRAPVLEKDDGTTLWESAAIMVFLAVQARSDFWPVADPERQAEALRWISWDLCEFMPHTGAFYFEHHIKQKFGLGGPDRAALEQKLEPLHTSARILDAHLADRRFLTGETLSVADFCVGVLLPQADEIELPLSGYRNIQRWHDRLMTLEAWRNPWP
jgi:glutathione S-transferase